MGYTIKPTAIIILFVIVIVEIIKIINKINKTLVKNNLIALSMIFISAVPVLIFNSLSRNTLGLELDKNQNFTFYHYIMTGLNNERQGAYLDEDVRFSSSFNTINERNSANITVIKERLSNFGFFGYINFLGRKALVNFSDGSFAWGCEGNFYADIPDREGLISTLFENIYYRNGIYHIYFLTIVQLLWFVVLILLFGLSIINNHNYNILALILTIITIFSFVMVFESRARYLLVYSPFFTIGAGIGANNISLWLSSMKNKIIKTG